MEIRRRFRRLGRTMATILWFRVDDGWIYYVIVGGYAAIVSAAVWLLTRHGWLPVAVGFVVLLDGMTGLLVLLNRWLTRRLRGPT
jgi:hypothetical protein